MGDPLKMRKIHLYVGWTLAAASWHSWLRTFLVFVMAGLDPAIPIRRAWCSPKRDARVKPAHDDRIFFEVFA
ncbi:MAG: hypothetical protein ABUL48_06265 [Pseudorhodoplanes sp.]